jgi:hypothetical protein
MQGISRKRRWLNLIKYLGICQTASVVLPGILPRTLSTCCGLLLMTLLWSWITELEFCYDLAALERSTKFLSEETYYVRFEVFTAGTMKKACLSAIAHAGSSLTSFFFLLPWRWRRNVPPKRRLTQYLHGATSQKTGFFNKHTNSGIISCKPHSSVDKNLSEWRQTYFIIWSHSGSCSFIMKRTANTLYPVSTFNKASAKNSLTYQMLVTVW